MPGAASSAGAPAEVEGSGGRVEARRRGCRAIPVAASTRRKAASVCRRSGAVQGSLDSSSAAKSTASMARRHPPPRRSVRERGSDARRPRAGRTTPRGCRDAAGGRRQWRATRKTLEGRDEQEGLEEAGGAGGNGGNQGEE